MTRVVYLHGFASSPQSSKAQYFARKFAERGVPVEIPRLDDGDFERLTVTGQLGVIERAVGGRPAVLMGSSLGGYLAALYAARHPEIEKVVLLAPAFQFPSRFRTRYTQDELERWKWDGSAPVFHYGYQRECQLGYQLLEDAAGYEDEPDFRQPGLIIHGRQDPVVPAAASEGFTASHPNVILRLMDSGHELTDVLDPMWALVEEFLEPACDKLHVGPSGKIGETSDEGSSSIR
jgi:pimeloyl-ACP methyl ester carboxylesterase